jgi:ribonuclease HIII
MTKIVSKSKAIYLKEKLFEEGYSEFEQNNQYVMWSLKKGKSTVTYYTSGKLYITKDEEIILSILDEEYFSTIGADESGKGDYFGPLVVCAAYIPKTEYKKIYKLNIRDSKKIDDKIISKIFESENFKYEIKILKPEEYNRKINKYKNLNILLTETYKEIITKLKNKTKCERIVIDAYQSPDKIIKSFDYKILATTKAEEKELSVALASVIARYFFLQSIKEISNKYSMDFPKGSSNVINFAKQFVKKYGEEELYRVSKIHFSLTQKILRQ